MNDSQIEKAEQYLGYYDIHGMNWRIEGDIIALLRDMLPDWSAFKESPPDVGPCAVMDCQERALYGAIFQQGTEGQTCHPTYYYCTEHISGPLPKALKVWQVA